MNDKTNEDNKPTHLDHWASVADQHATIEGFIDWVGSIYGVELSDSPLGVDTRELLDEFLKVDRKALDKERRALLATEQQRANGSHLDAWAELQNKQADDQQTTGPSGDESVADFKNDESYKLKPPIRYFGADVADVLRKVYERGVETANGRRDLSLEEAVNMSFEEWRSFLGIQTPRPVDSSCDAVKSYSKGPSESYSLTVDGVTTGTTGPMSKAEAIDRLQASGEPTTDEQSAKGVVSRIEKKISEVRDLLDEMSEDEIDFVHQNSAAYRKLVEACRVRHRRA